MALDDGRGGDRGSLIALDFDWAGAEFEKPSDKLGGRVWRIRNVELVQAGTNLLLGHSINRCETFDGLQLAKQRIVVLKIEKIDSPQTLTGRK